MAAEPTYDALAILRERISGIAKRLRSSPDWPPESLPTLDDVKQRTKGLLAARAVRR
jgi:hypothetical protein